jgi:hypothetical protein
LDDATGAAGNCPGSSCSLRDALAAAAMELAGVSDNITFDPTVFPTGPGAAVQTIKLGSALTIGSNDSIVGPGANLLTISGQGQVQVFTVNSGLAASISGLTVANGHALGDGGGIDNSGTLTVSNTTISDNTAITDGGGIFNTATLTVSNSTISDNSASNSGGIFSSSALMVTNSILTGDTGGECIGAACPTSGTNGNVVSGVALAPLGFYGGPTQTIPPAGQHGAECRSVSDGRADHRPARRAASFDCQRAHRCRSCADHRRRAHQFEKGPIQVSPGSALTEYP